MRKKGRGQVKLPNPMSNNITHWGHAPQADTNPCRKSGEKEKGNKTDPCTTSNYQIMRFDRGKIHSLDQRRVLAGQRALPRVKRIHHTVSSFHRRESYTGECNMGRGIHSSTWAEGCTHAHGQRDVHTWPGQSTDTQMTRGIHTREGYPTHSSQGVTQKRQ